MTLHWWMHWFWVTMLLVVFASINSSAAPQSEELQHITTDDETKPERRGRAMYYTKTTILTTSTPPPLPLTQNTTQQENHQENTTTTTEATYQEPNNTLEVAHPEVIALTNQTSSNSSTNITTNATDTEIVNLEPEETSANRTDDDNSTRKLNLTGVKEIDSGIEVAESRIVSERPLSLETSFLQTRLPPLETSRRILDQERPKSMDTGAIAGISFASVVIVALVGSTGLVLYRRRAGGPHPEALHDKCSNPDSTHYLDDSTVRDNSEEMYSLDNDSFLNSLEAMTIQNYWTDTVKHTKL